MSFLRRDESGHGPVGFDFTWIIGLVIVVILILILVGRI